MRVQPIIARLMMTCSLRPQLPRQAKVETSSARKTSAHDFDLRASNPTFPRQLNPHPPGRPSRSAIARPLSSTPAKWRPLTTLRAPSRGLPPSESRPRRPAPPLSAPRRPSRAPLHPPSRAPSRARATPPRSPTSPSICPRTLGPGIRCSVTLWSARSEPSRPPVRSLRFRVSEH